MATKRPPKATGKKLNAAQRSLKLLRDQGFTAEVCEKYVSRPFGNAVGGFSGGFRKDLFNFMDILAFSNDEVIAVQTTSRQQMTAHLRKFRRDAETADAIRKWLFGLRRRMFVHGWEPVMVPTKKGAKCGTRVKWTVDIREVTPADLDDPRVVLMISEYAKGDA
jgi:hypothetical protein